jgi:uncharacterized protein YpuA (DUF1002 family)
MNTFHNWINSALLVAVIVLVLVSGNFANQTTLGGSTSDSWSVGGDLSVNTSDLFVDVSTSRVGIGTTTPLDITHVENQTATSTLIISTGASAKGGRIILEDHDGAGCSEIAILNGTVAAKTVACPAGI